MMKFKVKSFKLHKRAEDFNSCQDAVQDKGNRIAIADGATESFKSEIFSQALVDHFCLEENELPNNENWKAWLEPIQSSWNRTVEKQIEEKIDTLFTSKNRFILREPAASTFIGLNLKKTEEEIWEWEAMMIGDSCLFEINGSKESYTSYLLKDCDDFDSFPEAFASYPIYNTTDPKWISGTLNEKDDKCLLLATDAIAKWIICSFKKENPINPFEELLKIESQDEFLAFAETWYEDENYHLENDDLTFSIISFDNSQNEISDSQSSDSEEEDIPNSISIKTDTELVDPVEKEFIEKPNKHISKRILQIIQPIAILILAILLLFECSRNQDFIEKNDENRSGQIDSEEMQIETHLPIDTSINPLENDTLNATKINEDTLQGHKQALIDSSFNNRN